MSQTIRFESEVPSEIGAPPDFAAAQSAGLPLLIGGVCLGLLAWRYKRAPQRTTALPVQEKTQEGVAHDAVGGVSLAELRQRLKQSLHWLGYGKSLEKDGRYADAVQIYDWAIEIYPQDYKLWHERGLALAKLERFEDAIASYDRAHELRPQQRDLAHERGDALLELERYEEALESFDLFLRYAPNTAHVLGDRGYALYQLGRYTEALPVLNQAMQYAQHDRPSATHAHYYQIATLYQLGQLEAALDSARTAIRRYPQQENFDALETRIQAAMG